MSSPKVSARTEQKLEFNSAQKPYIPVDQILQKLVCPNKNGINGNTAKYNSLSKYYKANMLKMKPNTATMNKRQKVSVRSGNNKLLHKRQIEQSFDLPYVNEREKNSFLSSKINLMPRFHNVMEREYQRDNLNRSVINEVKFNQTKLILPKIEDEVQNELLCVKNDKIRHQESNCTYKVDESDNDSGDDAENYQRESNDSPIKKWLSHNRNFDIKINLVVNGNEKINKASLHNI